MYQYGPTGIYGKKAETVGRPAKKKVAKGAAIKKAAKKSPKKRNSPKKGKASA